MIGASSLFNALPPFADGNVGRVLLDPANVSSTSSGASSAGASAADAFAALLAELDPSDLQAALSPSALSTRVEVEEATAASPSSTEGAVPLLPLPLLLNVQATRSSRADADELIADGSGDKEATSQQDPVLDPLAFLLAQALPPVPDRTPIVALPLGLAATIADVDATIADVDATLQGRPEGEAKGAVPQEAVPAERGFERAFGKAAVSEDAQTSTQVLPESTEGAFPLPEAVSPIELAEAEASAADRAEQPARVMPLPAIPMRTVERPLAQEAIAPLPESFDTGTVTADKPAIDLRKSVDDTVRTTTPAKHELPASQVQAQQEIPRDTGDANPQAVEGRWVQAVRRFVAQATAAAAEARPDSGNTAPLPAERNTLTDGLRFAAKGAEERLAALTQSPEFQGGNRDQQASQRGAAGSLVLHAPSIAPGASSVLQFALPAAEEAPLPEDAALARQIVQAAHLQWRNGGGDARLTLHPEYLGEVQISIRVESGAVTATMKAAEPEVRAWMQAHESLLKQGLAEQGLRLDELHVEDGHEEREAGRHPGGDRQPHQQRPRSPQAATVPVFELPL